MSSTRFNVAMWIKIMASYSHKFAYIFASIWSFLVLFSTFLALFGSFHPKLKPIKNPVKSYLYWVLFAPPLGLPSASFHFAQDKLLVQIVYRKLRSVAELVEALLLDFLRLHFISLRINFSSKSIQTKKPINNDRLYAPPLGLEPRTL